MSIVVMALPRRVAGRPESRWPARLDRPGYLLLPLRLFLGVTFCFAGLQKLANPAYLDRTDPTSVYAQMHGLEGRSPLAPLISLSVHAPTLVGLLIALGELAVGIGTLLGLLSRVAAVGGALLALSFFLTVSWNTTPYYYGSDIVFLFAWTVLIGFGSGGVLSLDRWLRDRARRSAGLPRASAVVAVDATRLRELCGRGATCGLDAADGECGRLRGCSVFPPLAPLPAPRAEELGRRTLLANGVAVAGVGALAAVLAAVTAAVGRAADGSARPPIAARTPGRRSPGTRSPGTRSPGRQSPTPKTTSSTTSPQSSSGVPIMAADTVPVGQAKPFTDPRTRRPAWLVHVSRSKFAAFSAVCTHAGCTVAFDSSADQFVCPCHGGTYSARTGDVLAGPPPAPLAEIPVHVHDGKVFTT